MADTINHPTLPPRDAPALLLIAGMVLLAASAASAVEPVEVPDNPSCQSLGFQNELKIDPPASGTYTIPGTSKTVTVTVDGANRFFDWSSTLGMDAVIVKGGDSANLYRYDPPAESFGDTGLHSPLCPSGQYCGLSHISFCYDWEVSVAKTAATSYTRTWQWAITKTAAPAVWNIFNGDRGTSLYAVSLLKTGYTDSNFAAAGAITVTNDTPYAASLTSVTDSVAGYTATVDCGVSFPYTLAAGATLGCTYTVALPNAEPRTNTATVTATGTVGGGLGTAAVAFGEPTTVVNGTVNVSDTNGGSWTFADSGSVNYTADFACPGDAGTHGNTATIVETGQSSSASVTVNCYALQVTKTALTSYDRNFQWTLDKSVNPSAWDLFNGDSATSQYTVTATRGAAVESNFAVAGIITVSNLNPARAATVNSVTDIVSGPISAPVTCGVTFPYLLGAGSQLQCSYGAPLPDKTNRTNTATATQQNFAYPLAGDPAPLGISSYSGDATVDFAGATVRETNASLTVADSYAGAGSPWTFNGSGSQSYSRTFNCGADEGSHDNTVTATLTGGGTLTDNASVHVDCHALSVNKSATAEYTRNFTWQIAKSADPAAWNLFDGDSGTTQYTVTLTKDEGADSAFGVSGSIWIANPSTERDALLTSVTDLVSPDIAAAVVCPSMTVPKGGTLTCTYTAALLDKSTRINTATAVQQNYAYTSAGIGAPSGTTSYSGNADVVFGDPTTEINGTVHVNDSNGTAWTFSASGSQTYTQPFTCAGVTWSGSTATFTHLNTAEILETDQTATASVDVQCYRLAVTKTAETAYRRTWAWTIDKSADQTSLTLSAGQQFQVNYSVAMGATSTDDQFAASGEIYVVNPNPSREATLASVTDAVTGGYAATVTCPTTTVTAGATLTCTYTVGLPDASGRVNTATAT